MTILNRQVIDVNIRPNTAPFMPCYEIGTVENVLSKQADMCLVSSTPDISIPNTNKAVIPIVNDDGTITIFWEIEGILKTSMTAPADQWRWRVV